MRNRCSALSDGRCECPDCPSEGLRPLIVEASQSLDLMPLQEGKRFKPEYEGYARVQVAVDSGAATSV
eukprot:3208712-Alexandrium_andersonii.AAC.1